MEAYASKIVERVTDFILDVSIRHLSYIICYKGNLDELNSSIVALEGERDNVKHDVDDAENNVKGIESNVRAWFDKVEKKIEDCKEFHADDVHKKTGCSRGILPFLWYRHKLGRKARKMTMDIKLLKDEKFTKVSYRQHPRSADIALSNAGYEEFESRKDIMKKIMVKLEDSTVRMIGVHGPGGVGKTTLVKEIAKEARDRKLFSVVVIVSITKNPNRQKVQEEIAYNLGLTFEGEGEIGRADRLRRRLMQEKENTLVILDDLWDGLDLNMLGIPFDDDDLGHVTMKDRLDFGCQMTQVEKPSSHYDGNKLLDSGSTSGTLPNEVCLRQESGKSEKGFSYKMVKDENFSGVYRGCKILLTSRIKEVLSGKMNVKENSIFPVMELKDEEAVKLFKAAAEIDEDSKFEPEIVKKHCGGLPMAILTVGKALKNKSKLVWEEVLEKLNKQELMGVQKSMEISVKMSYDHLESEELKSIFLLCAQMGHQPLIVDLVKYSFGLGILKGVHTLKDARERIRTSIQKLKDSSLMLEENSSDHFNMHDMVRDAALSIAQKEHNVFTLRNDKLDDWPSELERCTVISIYKSDIVDELPEVINCPQLRVFHIDGDDLHLDIHDKFFEGMKKLRVLILTGIHLSCLPSSIECLSNLRMLCLERCVLGDLSIIRYLKKLRILSLSGSKIKAWPGDLAGLSKLHLLDISDCTIVNSISPKFISSLTCLEELYMRKSLINMEVEGETNQSQVSILSELKQLHQLKLVDMCLPNAEVLPTDVFFDKLDDYKIVIGDFKMLSISDFKMPNKYEASRTLALQLRSGINIHTLKGIKMLFKRVENLLLGELNGVQNVFYELSLDGFPNLKHLSIINNSGIEYIVNSMEMSHPHIVFPNLESLNLFNLMNIKEICRSPVRGASFSQLKTIKVKMCTQLKNIFSFYIVKFLTSLKAIDISKCDYLEEIVLDEREMSDKVEFHKLCSLTLQELPSFIGFYTNSKMISMPQLMDREERRTDHVESVNLQDKQCVRTSFSLFGERVEIPNLESLKVSSIDIDYIWSDQISSFRFENLIKLTVEVCCNLTYLCSLSVAKSLNKLKGLFVSGCRKMEKLFITEGNTDDYSEVHIFPKLEEIHLTNMGMLKDIWPVKVHAGSFPKLISVHIDGCKKLEKIFPSHMEGCYQTLDSLKVINCEAVEVIFECPLKNDASLADMKLQLILLQSLPNLNKVWSRDPEGVVDFKSLRSIKVSDCEKLSNVLPASIAKGLKKLEELSIKSCGEMEEIVDAGSETNNEQLEFPEVTSMELCYLRNIRHFYNGRQSIECPKLKRLVVNSCVKLRAFTTDEEGIPVFSAEKVISNLEYMDIDSKEAKWLKRNIRKYHMHCLKQLCLRSLPNVEILYWFLHRIPNLERLELSSPHYDIQELVPSGNTALQERLGTVLQLKELIVTSSNIKDIGFERDPVLQRVERLVLFYCRKLINLVKPSVSLTHLTYLEIHYCSELKSLMSSSTAKSLVQLTTMKISDCKLKEIVINEGNAKDTQVDIVFGKLITIEFRSLKKLTSFCSCKNCEFSFPSLEKLILRNCPKMTTFTESDIKAPKLQNVLSVDEREEEIWYWEGDLNATIKKAFAEKVSFEYTSHLKLSHYPELEQVWCGKYLVQRNSFHCLKTLSVENCGFLVHVLPSHLLPYFKNLEELVVDSCDQVQVIFEINVKGVTEMLGMFRLKKLSIRNLPKLEHVWDNDPHGIIGLKVLQDVRIYQCHSLKYVFPASMAKDLTMLKELSVESCEQLVEIFGDNETALERDTKSFVFPSLKSLMLNTLPLLKCFYPGLHKLDFPVLKEVQVHPSKWVILNCQEAYPEEQVSITVEKVHFLLPSLERLSFNIGNGTVTLDLRSLQLEFMFLSFQHLKEVRDSVLYRFLQMVPDVEKLEVKYGCLEEMFSKERLNTDCAGILSHLKELRLVSEYSLKSIGLEHSWVHSIPENMQTLQVEWCSALKNLVQCTVSFSNLTNLVIIYCRNLLYLFTTSTAKSLGHLERMEIQNCRSLQEIVSIEVGKSSIDGNVIFKQLRSLILKELPKLTCFYPGNLTLSFQSLEEVSIFNCPLMKMFCPRVEINQHSNRSPGVGLIKDAYWEGDFGNTICKMYERKIAESACNSQYLSLSPCYQEIWYGLMPVPDVCFSNLESLVVEGCEFLSEVIPFNLLPLLSKIQSLEVRNCHSVKTIFDVKCVSKDKRMIVGSPQTPVPFSLKKLIVKKLPNLECVWNEDPDGVLTVQLQKVHVERCKRLTSLFPASTAKDLVKLENLVVKHCEKLVEIVAGIEAAPKGTNLDFIFPCLTSLTLLDLPKLNCFYCSLHCVQLKTFTGQDPQVEDQVCAKEATSLLDNLSLGEKELKMIWHGQCQGTHIRKVKVLDLQSFNDLEQLPCGFLQKVPNIEELVVSNSSFKEIFCSERSDFNHVGILSQLKGLKLASLSELVTIGLEHSWVGGSLLKNLETLEARSCSRLRNLVPSAVCFSSLKHLTASYCSNMIHLFTCSAAKSLAQLEQINISCCDSIEEILSREEDEFHHDEIIFAKLHKLNLEYLPRLKSFYQGSVTLNFPSLEKLSVIQCQRMDTFCAGTLCTNKLLEVKFQRYGDATPLKVDLNHVIRKSFEARVAEFVRSEESLNLVDEPQVHGIWHGPFPVPFRCFVSLKSLIVERCEFLYNVIPSHLLGLLCKLEELVVRECHSVKAIFEVKDIAKDAKLNTGPGISRFFCLKKLTFDQLPNLEHVWDSDSEEVIGLETLQEVCVHGCGNLERLFPASAAKSLVKLEKLEVKECGRLMEIVAKDDVAAEAPDEEFVLPCVTSIILWSLPELKCFYPGPHKLECPKLKQINLFHCEKLKIFTYDSQSFPKEQPDFQDSTKALFLVEKVMPSLEFLALSKEEAMIFLDGQFHVNLLHKLPALQLQCFHDDSDTFPYGLLQMAPNIEKLSVSCCSFKDIFCSTSPDMDCVEKILSRLKCLQLNSLSELNSIGLEHNWMDPISKNFEKLQIDQCHCLRNLVPCDISFSSLTDLNVSQCNGLVYLFTPSTSRTMCQLKNMSIENCESLEEIVFGVVEESSKHAEEEIIFEKLNTLSLQSLPRLGRFYNGNIALNFPSLEQISVIKCRRMESFCAGTVSVNKWSTIQLEEDKDAVQLEFDLNFTILKAFDLEV
ncbi:uncharacterized protein LOC130935134 [Arachis stenosperma]|uniref:uncharacterized protein LOC130935134 n=1 Tax=Arachis stenosperma TaxID=217475 RepID=UPI0025ABB82F|nr:uncharacterized protein LOC130935134 [Arachis stenosperma]